MNEETRASQLVRPVERITITLPAPMLARIDEAGDGKTVTRSETIRSLLDKALS